jgi:hypothetical protein
MIIGEDTRYIELVTWALIGPNFVPRNICSPYLQQHEAFCSFTCRPIIVHCSVFINHMKHINDNNAFLSSLF